jgi:uroporphyrinogen-III decarboxylase
LWGNLDPVAVLAQGSVAQVAEATRRVLETVQANGHRRFVFSSGCTLAMETPSENLDAMLRTAEAFNSSLLHGESSAG